MILILGSDEGFDLLTPYKILPTEEIKTPVVSRASGSNFGVTDDLVCVLSKYLVGQANTAISPIVGFEESERFS